MTWPETTPPTRELDAVEIQELVDLYFMAASTAYELNARKSEALRVFCHNHPEWIHSGKPYLALCDRLAHEEI